jgi:gliding motility-associated-like protein
MEKQFSSFINPNNLHHPMHTIVLRYLAAPRSMVYFFMSAPFSRKHLLRNIFILSAFFTLNTAFAQPCPTLSQSSTLTSSDCASGINPCTVCPGDMITLNTSGTNIQPGTCIDWYYGTTPTFNPYLGQGTFMGCALVAPNPPNSCVSCPLTLALYVNACGTEENNEILAMLSGSGFFVDDLTLDFDDANDNGAGNFDIGSGCGWQDPTPSTIATIQSICTGALIVGAGPGDAVPANVPVIVFTSAGYNFNYNFGSLCPLSPVIYVLQNGCTRTTEAFTNSPGSGSVSTNVGLGCGCSDNTTYNINSLVGGDGAFVTDANFFPFYGNASCGFPSLPGGGGGGGSTAIVIPPFNYTIPQSMCNGGPYWARGILNPPRPGCPQVLTNALAFNVPCPNPVLLSGPDLCQTSPLFNLTALQDPTVTAGTWSGSGVTGVNFNPSGQIGPITLTFTPSGPCGTAATTTINVFPQPTAIMQPIPSLCSSQQVLLTINFTGQAPFTFNLFANGVLINNYVVTDNTIQIPVTPVGPTTTYNLNNFFDDHCNGAASSLIALVTQPGTAILSLNGPNSICTGQNGSFIVDFSSGNAPFTFIPVLNGIAQPLVASNTEPVSFTLPMAQGNNTITITNALSDDCIATASGTATVTGIAAPTAQLVSSTKTICQGQSDTIRVNVTGSGSLTYSLNGIPQAPVNITAPLALIPVNTNLGVNIFTLNSYTGGICPGMVSGRDTTIVQAIPSAALSGSTSLCVAGTVPLSLNFTPNIPATVNYTANGMPQPLIIASSSPYTLSVTPSVTTTYTLTSINAGVCSNTLNASATVAVGSGPTAVLSGGGNLCVNGGGDTITITLSGGGPYTFVYSIAGVAQAPITTNLSVYKIFVNPTGYTKYQMVSVSNPTCTGTVSGMAQIFVFVSSNADLPMDLTFCNGVSTTILANVTGTAPFTLTYSANNIVQPPITLDDGPIPISVNITQTTTYKLISIQSPGCNQSLSDSMTITIHPTPIFANLVLKCNSLSNTYTVEFDVLNGTAPYTLTGGLGTFTGNRFVSQPIPQASNYNFVFHDKFNCGDATVSGVTTCNCSANAGTMNLTPLNLCAGATAVTTHNGDQTLDQNDILLYILHTSPSTPLGNILAWNTTPSFAFQPAYQTGTTYYISAIAGNPDVNGQVDLNDICLSVAVGTPVTWRALPSASLSGNINSCIGESFSFPVIMTGIPPFTVDYTFNGQPNTFTSNQLSFDLQGLASVSGDYALVTVSDNGCTSTATGTATITVHTKPTVSGLSTLCDLATSSFTVSFTVNAEDLNAVNIQGQPGIYNAQTGVFTSDPIAKTTPYSFLVSDTWKCDSVALNGTAICNCTTDAGTIPLQTPEACQGATLIFTGTTGSNLNPGDIIRYFLTTSSTLPYSPIIAQSNTPSFNFVLGQTIPGTTYYVVAVVGPALGTGIDLTHPCTNYSNAIPVRWKPRPTLLVTTTSPICKGQLGYLTISLFGANNYQYDITSPGSSIMVVNDTSQTNIIEVNPTVTTNYTITNFTGDGCTGPGGPMSTIVVSTTPEIVDLEQICAPDKQTFVLQFKVSNGSAPNTIYSVSGITGSFTDTLFTSDPINSGSSYGITVSNAAGCSSSIGGFGNCECQSDAGTLSLGTSDACTSGVITAMHDGNQVLDTGDGLYYILCTDPAILPVGLIAVNDIPEFGFSAGMAEEFTYYIVAVVSSTLTTGEINFTNPCIDFSTGIPVVFHNPPEAILGNADTLLCTGESFFLPIQLTGNAPFTIQYGLNGVQLPDVTTNLNNFTISSSNIQGNQLFQLIGVSDTYCSGSAIGNIEIKVQPKPEITLLGGGDICPGGSLTLTIALKNASIAQVEILSSTGVPIALNAVSDGFTFQVSPNSSTTYSIGNVFFTDNDCAGKIQGSAIVNVFPIAIQSVISDYNGFGISCTAELDGSVIMMATGGSGSFTYLWSTGATSTNLAQLGAGSYYCTITDNSGCSIIDSVDIIEPLPLKWLAQSYDPLCFGTTTGSIALDSITGGSGGYSIWMDNGNFPVSNLPLLIDNLGVGAYEIVIIDNNGCKVSETLNLSAPPELLVNLGDDRMIALGDSVNLIATTNSNTLSNIVWTPSEYLTLTDNLFSTSKPLNTIIYTIKITNNNGCTATDEVTIMVDRENKVFIPNVFSPDSGDENSNFTIYAGLQVVNVKRMQIFDRWGEMLFEQRNFLPNNPNSGWNGIWRSKPVNPGVYVYLIEFERINGEVEILRGSITVVR